MTAENVTIISSVLTMMGAAVLALWKWALSRFNKGERDRDRLWWAVYRMAGSMQRVQGCSVTGCQMKTIAEEALEEAEQDLAPDEVRRRTMSCLKAPCTAEPRPVFSASEPILLQPHLQ